MMIKHVIMTLDISKPRWCLRTNSIHIYIMCSDQNSICTLIHWLHRGPMRVHKEFSFIDGVHILCLVMCFCIRQHTTFII